MSFSCPLCHAPLTHSDKSYTCPQGHQFDMAKEGYVNLLPVQHKRSRDPGDSAEMMQARRAFLDAGHYLPLRETVAQMLNDILPGSATAMLDIGCGEGYYTARFAGIAREKGALTFGLDVSKVAIRAAAKRYADVTPGPRHLMELKGLIYDEVRLHAPHSEQLAGFTLKQEQTVAYEMKLKGEEATALLQMTPFAWRAKPEVWEALALQSIFNCQTDFSIHVWQRED